MVLISFKSHSGPPKIVTVVYPSVEKGAAPGDMTVKLNNETEFKAFRVEHQCALTGRDGVSVMSFNDLLNNGVYSLSGPLYQARVSRIKREQVDDRIFDFEAGYAVHRYVSDSASDKNVVHLHTNVTHVDATTKQTTIEIDNIVVHSAGEDDSCSLFAALIYSSVLQRPIFQGALPMLLNAPIHRNQGRRIYF